MYSARMTFDPRLYRLLHRGSPGDVDFYRARCAGADRVLELGAGDGRISIPLARDGCRVVGIELHPGMLAAARAARRALSPEVAARLVFVPGDMARLDAVLSGLDGAPARFDRVVVPYTALYCLDPEARGRCLEAIARRLAPGGRLIFDAWPGDGLRRRGAFRDRRPEWIDGVRDGDTIIEVFERDTHVAGRIDVTYIHQIAAPGQMPTRESYTLRHHYLCTDEVRPTLAAAGLAAVEVFGDFEGGPLDAESERLVVIARAADEAEEQVGR